MAKYKSKYEIRKRKKYSPGGMYEANTIQQAGMGSTESIVYDEADPRVLEAAKNAKLQNEQTLSDNAENVSGQIQEQLAADKAAMEQNVAQKKAKQQSVDSTVGKSIDTLTDGGKSTDIVGNLKDKVMDVKYGAKEAYMNLFQKKAVAEAKKKAADSIAGGAATEFGNLTRQKAAEQFSASLSKEAMHKGTEITLDKGSQMAWQWGGDQASNIVMPGLQDKGIEIVTNKAKDIAIDKGKDIVADKVKDVAIDKGKDVLLDKTKEKLTEKATEKLVEKGTEKLVEKGTEKLVEEGTKKLVETGVKEGAKSAAGSAINPNPYATVANLAGTAISMGADDNDATTWTAGEATGDILAKAGSYAGYGAMLGSAVPVVGNLVGAAAGAVIGAGVATWQGLANRKKARREEEEMKAKAQEKANELNTKTKKDFTGQLARTRAAELEAKTYSGYDLGANVTARRGGFAAMPEWNKQPKPMAA